MNIVSKKNWFSACHSERSAKRGVEESSLKVCLLSLFVFILCSCDFQGPWSYYPEETKTYLGIYTYGYIVAEQSPYVCFSKVYKLNESSSEDFAFYDSAYVTVSGKFASGEATAELEALKGKPNCFGSDGYEGVAGEAYEMKAFFKWDSAGKKVKTEFKAEANIPTKIHAKGILPPTMMGNGAFVENDYKSHSFEHLGFPFDVNPYKVPLSYDESVYGLLVTLGYDNENGGESMNNTINGMMSSLIKPDSMGYTGISLISSIYNETSLGFTTRMSLAGINSLDTMEFTGMTTPIGKMTLRFYATDKAYSDYKNTVLQALDDPRVVAKSNVENGMGVFSGMLKDSLLMEVTDEDAVPLEYIRKVNCENTSYNPDSTGSMYCRLYAQSLCVDSIPDEKGKGVIYEVDQERAFCYPIAVKFAMSLDTTKWSLFLPDTLSEKKKSDVYADGLKRYCVSSNFESNSIADCKQIYEDCQVAPEKNYCKKYLWQWCSDRDWDYEEHPQCGTGLVSRYVIEKMNSSILKRIVENWCDDHPDDVQCDRL